jgi:hypothetical protein
MPSNKTFEEYPRIETGVIKTGLTSVKSRIHSALEAQDRCVLQYAGCNT